MGRFKLSDEAKRKYQKMAEEKARTLAIEARERMTEEYLNVISDFYSEYEPKYYWRHFNNNYEASSLKGSGLGRTFEKYYKNSHGSVFIGGIEISTQNMYSDYHDSQEDVLNSFLEGYHGRPSLGIVSSMQPYKHMLRYKDWLIAEFSERLKV